MRQFTFYLHWLVGLVAGTLLMVIGASGAVLTFEDQFLDWLNPGIRTVVPQARAALDPVEMLAAVQRDLPGRTVGNLTVFAQPGHSARVMLQAERGARPEALYANPYSGEILGAAAGQAFFAWTERLHRFLLLPREAGRVVAGTLSSCLLLLILSGIYLRWPARAGSLREWLRINPRLRGRPLLWSLHAVVATWVIPVWLLLAGTGIYWSFDTVRGVVDGLAGVQRQARPRAAPQPPDEKPTADLQQAWAGFAAVAGPWEMVRLSPPRGNAGSVEIVWLPTGAGHERALNRMRVGMQGEVEKDERFSGQSAGRRALATIYPLHMGRYFGLIGQWIVALAALALPLIGLTGWWLYLQRRRQAGRAAQEKKRLTEAAGDGAGNDEPPVLIAFASQTGRAESLALRTAQRMQQAGRRIVLRSLAQMSPPELATYPQALFVVSTYGDGQAPDMARGFARALAQAEQRLQPLNYAVLALGNRQYANFCGFGRFLHERLQQLGAVPHGAIQLVCESQPEAYAEWFASLQRFGVEDQVVEASPDLDGGAWVSCTLDQRACLNPGSSGAPLFELGIGARAGEYLAAWEGGALLEVRPRHAPGVVQAWAARFGLDIAQEVSLGSRTVPLGEVLACRRLPEAWSVAELPQISSLPLLAPRRYSVASIPADGCISLIVRQHYHDGKLGLASGWLTEHSPLGAELSVRLMGNPSFMVTAEPVPCIFIGAGSGLAGLRGLIRERLHRGLGQNWLILGERQAQYDSLCESELDAACETGLLQVDRVFSRDVTPPAYVQDVLREHAARVREAMVAGAHIHVCGSRDGMGEGVDEALREILGCASVDELAAAGRYRRDVY